MAAKLVKLTPEDVCLRPRVVRFAGLHEFGLVRRRRGVGYVARCRFCGLFMARPRKLDFVSPRGVGSRSRATRRGSATRR